MPIPSNNVAFADSVLAKEEILSELIKTSRVYAPLVTNKMEMVGEMSTRIEWADQTLGNDSVYLSSPYTAASGVMVVDASSLVRPYSIKVGVHQLQTPSGTALYQITGYNSTTNTINVTLLDGADANLASGAQLWLSRGNGIGEDAPAINDVQFATSDYNYISNFSFAVAISNPDKNGQLKYHFKEITFDNQLENNMPEAIRTLERRAWKDFRRAGTGAATRNGNTIQAGYNSRAGGVITLASARGLYTASLGSAVISEDLHAEDIAELRLRGAFTTINEKTRDMGLSYCRVYCNPAALGDFNKYVRINRAPEAFYGAPEKFGGTAGTFGYTVDVDGVRLEYTPTDGLAPNEIFYDTDEDLIKIKVLRMMEEQEPIYRGDNEIRTYQVSYTTTVSSPIKLGYRSNLVRL